jgi:hypothetical protein
VAASDRFIEAPIKKYEEKYSEMVFLYSYCVGTARSVRVYKTYGTDAVQVMSENPYRLTHDIRGIGIKFCIVGESLYRIAKRHDLSRQLIRVWGAQGLKS